MKCANAISNTKIETDLHLNTFMQKSCNWQQILWRPFHRVTVQIYHACLEGCPKWCCQCIVPLSRYWVQSYNYWQNVSSISERKNQIKSADTKFLLLCQNTILLFRESIHAHLHIRCINWGSVALKAISVSSCQGLCCFLCCQKHSHKIVIICPCQLRSIFFCFNLELFFVTLFFSLCFQPQFLRERKLKWISPHKRYSRTISARLSTKWESQSNEKKTNFRETEEGTKHSDFLSKGELLNCLLLLTTRLPWPELKHVCIFDTAASKSLFNTSVVAAPWHSRVYLPQNTTCSLRLFVYQGELDNVQHILFRNLWASGLLLF